MPIGLVATERALEVAQALTQRAPNLRQPLGSEDQ